jgi:hypothetical protein
MVNNLYEQSFETIHENVCKTCPEATESKVLMLEIGREAVDLILSCIMAEYPYHESGVCERSGGKRKRRATKAVRAFIIGLTRCDVTYQELAEFLNRDMEKEDEKTESLNGNNVKNYFENLRSRVRKCIELETERIDYKRMRKRSGKTVLKSERPSDDIEE